MTASFFPPGTVVAGRYEVAEEIGRGGVAVVYAARDRQVGSDVALKVLVPAPAVAHLVRARTRREIVAVRALAHPNVVPIYDLVEEGPWTVLVMERVLGGDLQAIVAERGPLPPEQVAAIGQGVAEALAAAHRRGIVHRDVKPRNILIDGDGRPRLTDFGAARVDGQETLTETGGVIGTLDYAAPEVMVGSRGDARADIHALGLTLYLALTGRLPARSAAHLPPTPAEDGHHPAAVRPEVPAWLDAAIARATAADPRGRFPTAAGFAQALATHQLVPLPPAAAPGRLDFCLACGAPEPFGNLLCRRCTQPGAGRGDSWLMVDPPRAAPDRRALATRIAALLHVPAGDEGARAAAQGERVLARLPAALASRAALQLQTRGIPTRLVSTRSDWRLLPTPLVMLGVAITSVGTLAGMTALPALFAATPAVTALLMALGYCAVSRPLLAAAAEVEKLPAAVVDQVASTMAALPDGDERLLLADIVRLARALFGREAALDQPVEALVTAACQAAAELGRAEQALSQLAEQRPQLTRAPESWGLESSRLETNRAALLQQLLDTIAILGTALAETVQPPDEVRAALARQSREILDELTFRRQAIAEVEEVVRGPG
jgi:hypothetical protein